MIAQTQRGMSARGATLLQSVRTTFVLLEEHQKIDAAEVALIVEMMASHIKSWRPLALAAAPMLPPPAITGTFTIERDLDAGASYSLRYTNGVRLLHLLDEHGHDALVSLSDNQRLVMADDLRRSAL